MMRGARSTWRAGVGAALAALMILIGAAAGAAPLSFTIGTSEPVVVDTTGGTPLIWLYFGGDEARAATYRSGSGTAALEFAYDIAAGDFAPAGIIAAGQIELAGGAILDLAGNPLTLAFTPPDLSGVRVRTYRPVWTTDPITAANASAAAFEITKAPLGASFAWEITSDGGGSLSGSGTIASAPHPVTGLDLSALGDGTLTLSLTLTTAAGTSAPRTVTVAKSVDWCTDPAALAAASPGAVCGDGSIYAGSLSGTYLFTHVSGCGYEPGGSSTTKASTSFTPSCGGGTDSTLKSWSSSTGANEGATSLTDGLANTNQLIADTQRLNPAAAYCYHLDLNGQTDWYLPARLEMNVLFINRTSIGGFAASDAYWTSSEDTSAGAWRYFNFGFQVGWKLDWHYRVRCVRRTN
jgi:hypothetical protein